MNRPDMYKEIVKKKILQKEIYALPDIRYEIKANQNENPYDLPRELKQRLADSLVDAPWNRYPRLGSGELREELANWLGCTNNPTGSTLRDDTLKAILEAATGLVLIDEAYIDFCDQDFQPLLHTYPNLVLTRTFSKAFAFAWCRFGYGIANDALVNEFAKVLLPYNLNGFTGQMVPNMVAYRGEMDTIIQQIVSERDRMITAIGDMENLTVFPSRANFFLVRPAMSSDDLFGALIARKILVRDVSHYPGLENVLRITVGTAEENERILASLSEIVGEG